MYIYSLIFLIYYICEYDKNLTSTIFHSWQSTMKQTFDYNFVIGFIFGHLELMWLFLLGEDRKIK